MNYRTLGRTDLEVSVIGFGCNRLHRRPDRQKSESIATLREAVERGVNFIDTANSYAWGDSESLLGEALAGRRDRVILCTKAGHRSWPTLHLDAWRGRPGAPHDGRGLRLLDRGLRVLHNARRNYAPKFLRLAIEGSLRRLRTDYVDLFYLHGPPPAVTSDPEVFETLRALRREGLIRHYGISCARATTADEALSCLRDTGISVLQVLTGPLERLDIDKVLPEAGRRGIAIVGRQPFHAGAVFSDPTLMASAAAVPGHTPAQCFLRSALQLNGVVSVLVGMRTRRHLHENLASLATEPLSATQMQGLSRETSIR